MSIIQTYTGRVWDLRDPRADNVDLQDIAMSLSQLVRFTGHCRRYAGRSYTVAQHCVLVSRRVAELAPEDYKLHLAGLLHDAHEAYIGDVSSPLKAVLRNTSIIYDRLDREHQGVVAYWAGLDATLLKHPLVHQADMELFATERRDLMHTSICKWQEMPEPLPFEIQPWDGEHACYAFCNAFVTLRRLAHLRSCKVEGAGYETLVL